jgi:hypothetical protein
MQKHMLESTHKQVVEFIILKSEKRFDMQLYYRFHTPALEIPHGRRLLLLDINNKMKSDSVIQYKDGSSQQWNGFIFLFFFFFFFFYKQQSTSECSVHSGITEVEHTERLLMLRVRIRSSGLLPLEAPLPPLTPPLASRVVIPRNRDVVVDPLAILLTSCLSCCVFRETPAPIPTERSFKLYWLLNWRQ